jgi:hypothetical protein
MILKNPNGKRGREGANDPLAFCFKVKMEIPNNYHFY